MDIKDRLEFFKDELALISNPIIREFVEECISQAPDYIFEDCPSSSSGKFHPVEELGPDGTLIHTKKVFALAYELSRGLDCEYHRDEICAAALLHDFEKQGKEKSGHTTKDHPQMMAATAANIYREKFRGRLERDSANIICSAIFYHYGPWTDQSVKKPLSSYTCEELAVYVADYVSSKRFVQVDYKRKLEMG
jgi:HD superfamily phosphohydrolase YqeK